MDFPLTIDTATVPPEADLREPDAPSPRSSDRWEERILYVDDDELARESFADAAAQLGFRVDTADGGGEALTMATRHRYAVIAADLRMPTLNGLSLIQLLRPKRPESSYLLVTGASRLDLPERANGEPLVDEIVAKPWNVRQLATVLQKAVRIARDRRSQAPAAPDALPVLVLDDGGEALDTASAILRRQLPEAEYLHARNLAEACHLAGEQSFRSAFVDLEAGGHAELELIGALRKNAPELPIIVLGTHDDEAAQMAALKAGAQDYLLKSQASSYNLRRSLRHVVERKSIEDRLTDLMRKDPVTGLANRVALNEELARAVEDAARRDGQLAVLLLDLDRFKIVNDSLGHEMGDRLLKVVAERIGNNLRENDTAARLGGDEFAIVLEGIEGESEAVGTAQRLLEALTPPARLNDFELSSTGSIGIAVYPRHGDSAGELLQRADKAMYQAKQDGRDGFAVYSDLNEESRSRVLERLTFESGIRHALERNEYVVYFQPQLSLDRSQLVGMEALVRWNHPKAGLVPPGRFIPFLESSGLIKGVGDWVLQTACERTKAWQEELMKSLRVSVNLSARQFEGTDLVATVERALSRTSLPPQDLELEITESLLMRDTERTLAILQELKTLGVRIAIDDFGTGYSSLAYLTTFPLDCLKIDRRFVHDITTNPDDRTVAEAIIGLGHSLDLDVVAEGVETEEQLAELQGCDGFQGFLISRPCPADDARELVVRYAGI